MNCVLLMALLTAVDSPTTIKARAIVAVVDARITAAQGPDLPDSKAKTKKTGNVPDIVLPPPPQNGGEFKLNLSAPKVVAGEAETKTPYMVKVYTMAGCIPCNQMKKECKDGNENVSLEWMPHSAPLPNGIPQVFPVSVWTDANGKVLYLTGRTTLAKLQEVIEKNNPPKSMSYAASGPGGAMHCRQQIIAMLQRATTYVKPGSTVRIVWKRNGGTIHSLLKKGKTWTHQEIVGSNGRLSISIDNNQQFQVTKDLTLNSMGFSYDLSTDGDHEVLRLTIDPLIVNFDGPNKVNSAVEGAVVGMDPITLAWTAISIIRFVVAVLNPDVSLAMGPAVECDAIVNTDSLKIVFNNDCPSIHVSAWFEFVIGLDNVLITPDLITVNFKSGSFLSRFVKQRTISVVD